MRWLSAVPFLTLAYCSCLGPEDCATPDLAALAQGDTLRPSLWDSVPYHSATSGGTVRNPARFEILKKQVIEADSGIEWVFIGNSITEYWGSAGSKVWNGRFSGKAINLGQSGDRTQDILFRLENGHLDFKPSVRPKAVVLLMGTNNIGNNSPLEIAEGIRANLQRLVSKWADTRIILMGIFPRDKGFMGKLNEDTFRINYLIKDYGQDPRVTYLDIGRSFIKPNGCIDPSLMYDGLHLSREGYRIWAEELESVLKK